MGKFMKENYTREKIFTIVKYLFSLALIAISYTTTRNARSLLLGFTELFLTFVLSDILVAKHKQFIWLNSVLMLILNVEYLILFFGGSFLTYVMLENVNSIQDLGGKAVSYGTGAILVLVCSFLPITSFFGKNKKRKYILLGGAVVLEMCALVSAGAAYSPYRAVYGIYEQWSMQRSLYENRDLSGEDAVASFYNGGEEQAEDVESNYSCNLSQPNIILIFTEGLSESIVQDSRNIMPNVAYMQNNSLNFTNYYNHTFATYRGLIGQLYSGHQRDDSDSNYLISIQDILKDQGYWTTMINTEPANETFSAYLSAMQFDEVISDENLCDGAVDTMSDGTAYEYLFDKAVAYEQEKSQPFFMVIYTFGTHATLDSTDQIYGDGTDRVLNRFYNVDYQFGKFIDKFNDSALASDTIVVFTADHATYADQDFLNAFPEYERVCSDVDEIPFFIYSVGGPVGQIDADGRNSLDMAPTLLNYLNIDAPNYFLGDALFNEKKSELSLDTFFYDPTYVIYTGNDSIETPDGATQELILDEIRNYFSASTNQNRS
jgi:phosphoglycerol transferase MdoB-like AlkP superfamily enzyme